MFRSHSLHPTQDASFIYYIVCKIVECTIVKGLLATGGQPSLHGLLDDPALMEKGKVYKNCTGHQWRRTVRITIFLIFLTVSVVGWVRVHRVDALDPRANQPTTNSSPTHCMQLFMDFWLATIAALIAIMPSVTRLGGGYYLAHNITVAMSANLTNVTCMNVTAYSSDNTSASYSSPPPFDDLLKLLTVTGLCSTTMKQWVDYIVVGGSAVCSLV